MVNFFDGVGFIRLRGTKGLVTVNRIPEEVGEHNQIKFARVLKFQGISEAMGQCLQG